jgi:hypothetical protein
VKIGVLLPSFRVGADDALAAASLAAAHGLDGVFAYDHLWPLGQPQRPSLAPFPLLAAVAARHDALVVAPLVARVGVVANDVLVTQFRALAEVAPGRVIAALGTGDRLSADENRAYGLPAWSASERRAMLAAVAGPLAAEMAVWVGAGAPATDQLARSIGAALNLWDRPGDQVAAAAGAGEVTWAGNARADLPAQLDELSAAGASWAVLAPTTDIAALGAWRRGH